MTALDDVAKALPDIEMFVGAPDTDRFVEGVRGETGKALAVLRPRTTDELHATCLLYTSPSPRDRG